uniref:Uncharacterized protein n=1 Tax=viral metagenome TaxID=1070528 RepID=A0A6C0HR70_9ZZZZ
MSSFKEKKLDKYLEKIIHHWPTSSKNIKNNCDIFNILNPSGLEIVGLDENSEYYEICSNYAYVNMCFIQIGLMNITYYSILDKLFEILCKKSTTQHGGMSLKKIINQVIYSFLLLSGSQLLNVDSNARNDEMLDKLSTYVGEIRYLDISTLEVDKNKFIRDLIQPMPLEYKTIADNLSEAERNFLVETIKDINNSLYESGTKAKFECAKMGDSVRHQELFNKDAKWISDYKRSKMSTTEYLTQNAFDFGRGIGKVSTAFYNGLTLQDAPESNEVETIDPFSYLNLYSSYCGASPIPKFKLEINKNNEEYSIKMQTYFGNQNMADLLKMHFVTVQKIDQKMSVTSNNIEMFNLRALKERVLTQIDLLTSSMLFMPLEVPNGPDLESTVNSIFFAHNSFMYLSNRVSEVLPITISNMDLADKIRKIANAQATTQYKEFFESWSILPKSFLKTLVTETHEVLNVTTNSFIGLAQDTLLSVSHAIGNVANNGVNDILVSLIPLFGVIASVAILHILYKYTILKIESSRRNGGTKKHKSSKGKTRKN